MGLGGGTLKPILVTNLYMRAKCHRYAWVQDGGDTV